MEYEFFIIMFSTAVTALSVAYLSLSQRKHVANWLAGRNAERKNPKHLGFC